MKENKNINETKESETTKVVGVDALVSLPAIQINEITHGDSLELTGCVPAKADLILEDMPYNTTQNHWDKEPIDLKRYWESRMELIKPTGVIILTATQPFTSKLILSNTQMYRYDLIWYKALGTGHLNANKMPMRNHEHILVFYKKLPTYNPIMRVGIMRTKGSKKGNTTTNYGKFDGKETINNTYYPQSVIDITNGDRTKENQHPTQKPVGLFEYLIKTYTNEGELVFDGFGGSGTTAIAAYRTKRNFIVIEKDKKYFEIASKRLYQERNPLHNFDEAS